MSKLVISYVLSTLAGVADVSPSDVETSMLSGTIVLRNVALRPTFLPGVLFDSANIDRLEVRLPILTSDAPIVARASGTTLVFPLDLVGPPSARTFTDIQAAITNTSILGYTPADTMDNAQTGADAASGEGGTRRTRSGASTPPDSLTSSFASSRLDAADSEDGEELLSCNSVDEDSESVSSVLSESEAEEDRSQGFFSRWQSKVMRGISKRWRHALRIELERAKIVLPCDTRSGLNYEAHVDSFVVTVEPQKMLENEQLSVHRLELRGIRVMAHLDDTQEPRVVDVDSLDVTITSVYHPKSGRLLRKNTAIALDGTCSVIANETTLFALIKCQMTRDIMMRLPDYCRPFAGMRRDRSLWKYAGCCVIKHIQDRKHRFNCTLAHLRFFADSRRRYVELLDACHRAHDVEAYRQQLAEAEQDLRYMDVIMFLRQHVRNKYGPLPAQVSSMPPSAHSAAPFSSRPPMASTHVDLNHIRLEFPGRQALSVSKVSLIMRDAEQRMQIGNVSLVDGDRSQSLLSGSACDFRNAEVAEVGDTSPLVKPLISLERRSEDGFINTKVVLAEVAIRLQMTHILAAVRPLLDTVIRIGVRERFPLAAASGGAASGTSTAACGWSGAATMTETVIVVVPHVVCRLDDLQLLVDHGSVTLVTPPEGPPQFACTLREASVQTVSDKVYVLSPVVVSASATGGGVVVSDVNILVRHSLWMYLRDTARQLPSIPLSLSAAGSGMSPAASAVSCKSVATHAESQTTARADCFPMHCARPVVKLSRLSVSVEPLSVTTSVSSVEVINAHMERSAPRQSYLAVLVGNVVMTCRDAASSMCLRTELAEGVRVCGLSHGRVAICVPNVRCGYTLPVTATGSVFEVPLLAVSTTCVSVVRNTASVDVARIVVADALEVAAVRLMVVSDSGAMPSNVQPYRSSLIQCSVVLKSFSLPPMLRIDTALLYTVVADAMRFLLDEVVPTSIYQRFFSAFSDVAVCVIADDCPVELVAANTATEEAAVLLSLSVRPQCTRPRACACKNEKPTEPPAQTNSSTPPPHRLSTAAQRLDLTDFGPSLFACEDGLAHGSPAVLRVDTRRRALILDVEGVELAVTYPVEDAGVHVCGHHITVEVPMERMDFWSEDERREQPVDPSFRALQLRGTVFGCGGTPLLEGCLREVDLCTGPRSAVSAAAVTTQPRSAVQATSGTSAVTIPLAAPRFAGAYNDNRCTSDAAASAEADQHSPSVESDMGSFASAAPSGGSPGGCSRTKSQMPTSLMSNDVALQLANWTAQVILYAPQNVYESVLNTASTLLVDLPCTVAAALAAQRCSITASCAGRTFDLDRLGPVVFHNTADLIVMDKCTFVAKDPASKRVVVTDGSSVFFRGCVFPCSAGDQQRFLRPAGAAAAIVCDHMCQYNDPTQAEHCFENNKGDIAPDNGLESVRPAVRSTRSRHRYALDITHGRLTALLPGGRVLELEQQRVLRAYCAGGSNSASAWCADVHSLQCAVLYRSASDFVEANVAICPNMVLDIDVRSAVRRRAFTFTAALAVEEVCVPLDSAIPAALRTVFAAVSRVKATRRQRRRSVSETGTEVAVGPHTPPPPPAPSSVVSEMSASRDSVASLPLLWDQWKVLLSISHIPIRVCLPNPNVTVAKVAFSNAFLWSVRDSGHTTATVEGRFALTNMLVRDLRAERLVPVLQTSTYLDIEAAFKTLPVSLLIDAPSSAASPPRPLSTSLTPSQKVTLAVRVPHTQFVISTDQIRLLTALIKEGVGAVSPSGGHMPQLLPFPPPGAVLQSYLGASSIRLQTTSGETVYLDNMTREFAAATRLLPPRQCLSMPDALVEVDQVPVVRAVPLLFTRSVETEESLLGTRFSRGCERGDCACGDRTDGGTCVASILAGVPILSQKHYGISLSDGHRLLCSATLLSNGTTWVTLRSVLVVRNRSPCAAWFRSDFSAPWPLDAGTVGSLPMSVADTIGPLSVSVGATVSPISLQEVLWEGTSPCAITTRWTQPCRWSLKERETPLSLISREEKEFVLLKDGSSLFLCVTTTCVHVVEDWAFVKVEISPSAPTLQNGTNHALRVDLWTTTASTRPLSFAVPPKETLMLTHVSAAQLESSVSACCYGLSLEVHPGVWATTTRSSQKGECDADSRPKWLHACSAVHFYVPSGSTPQAALPAVSPPFFTASIEGDGGAYVLSVAHLVRLANLSGIPLAVVSESARGTLSSDGVCYVPKFQPLYLICQQLAVTARSESFELADPAAASSRSGAFVSLGETAARGVQRCFLIRPALTEVADFVVQGPTWLTNETMMSLEFVWALENDSDIIDSAINCSARPPTVTVPAGRRAPFTWLPSAGTKGYFRFRPAAAPGASLSSPRIPGEWNPGTRQSFVVQCAGRRVDDVRQFFRVVVRKARFCDAAVIAVRGPYLPPLKIVNCSRMGFKDIPVLKTRTINRCVLAGDSLQLIPLPERGGPLWIPLDGLSSGRLRVSHKDETVVWHRVTTGDESDQSDSGCCAVVVVLQDLQNVTLSTLRSPFSSANSTGQPEPLHQPPKSVMVSPCALLSLLRASYGVECSLALQRVSVTVTHDNTLSVCASLDSARVWVDLASARGDGLVAVQCTVEGAQVQSTATQAGVPATTTLVVSPVGLNVSVRDAAFDRRERRLHIASLQLQVRPIIVTVCDVFLCTVQHIVARSVGTTKRELDPVVQLYSRHEAHLAEELDVFVHTALTAAAALHLCITSTTISEMRVELSYDRTVPPPDDYTLLRDVPMLSLIPSLYHAHLLFSARVFSNLGGTCAKRALTPVLESYVNDFLLQLPSTIGGVGLFRGTSFLQAAVSKLARLFMSNPSDSHTILPRGGSTLL